MRPNKGNRPIRGNGWAAVAVMNLTKFTIPELSISYNSLLARPEPRQVREGDGDGC